MGKKSLWRVIDVDVNNVLENFFNLKPYHITPFENVLGILNEGKILSKNSTSGAVDVGDIEAEKWYIFSDIDGDGINFKYTCIVKKSSPINLDNFVRFFLFYSRNMMPPFCLKFLEDILRNSIEKLFIHNSPAYGLSFMVFILKNIKELFEEFLKDTEHYIIYGPGAGYGQLINGIDNFARYVQIPSPDPLKISLWKFLQNMQVNPKSSYHKIIIDSELVVKDSIPLNLVEHVIVFIDLFFQEKFPDNFEEVKNKIYNFFGEKLKVRKVKYPFDYFKEIAENINRKRKRNPELSEVLRKILEDLAREISLIYGRVLEISI